jgi:DNA-binding IclR family transcriptional regulator
MMVGWFTGTHALPLLIRVGSTLPLLDSAVGCCFLAHLAKKATADVLRTQQHRGETRKLPAAKIDELRVRVREDGYSRTSAPIVLGLGALAAPVFGADGAIALVVATVLPARLMTEAETGRQATHLLSAVDDISRELGHRPAS